MSHLCLRYVYAGSAVYLPGETFGPRTLPDYEMVLVTAGTARYVVNGTAHTVSPGTFVIGRPGVEEAYEWDPRQATRHLYFHFDPARMPDDWPPPEAWPLLRATDERSPMPALMDHVVRLYEHDSTRDAPEPQLTRMVEALLSLFILGPVLTSDMVDPSSPAVPPPVMRAMDWTRAQLQLDPSTPIDLDALARAAAINPRHLCRLFADAVDTPPMRWVQHRRLDKARTLLRRSNLSVHQVADRCGFASPFHFSRAYKTRFGKPPSADRLDG